MLQIALTARRWLKMIRNLWTGRGSLTHKVQHHKNTFNQCMRGPRIAKKTSQMLLACKTFVSTRVLCDLEDSTSYFSRHVALGAKYLFDVIKTRFWLWL